jgi:hypothetical protein
MSIRGICPRLVVRFYRGATHRYGHARRWEEHATTPHCSLAVACQPSRYLSAMPQTTPQEPRQRFFSIPLLWPDAAQMLCGFNSHWFVAVFGIVIAAAIVSFRYHSIASIPKWLALTFFPMITAFAANSIALLNCVYADR